MKHYEAECDQCGCVWDVRVSIKCIRCKMTGDLNGGKTEGE